MAIAGSMDFAVSQAAAQEWAEKMFNKTEHDFGTVARGADTVYRFEITNLYKQDMHVTGVRSSCGCTSPSVENPIIKTHEKAYIVAKFNTRTHVGRKGATLTVNFGAPFAAEVQLRVHGNIRSDVVFNPGSIDFGDVNEGAPYEQQVTVTYAGRPDWQIVDVTNDNDAFEVELRESQRGGGRVSYNLLVRLRDAVQAGYIKDLLTVITNDERTESKKIPLYVAAHVRPEFSVTPATLVLDKVAPGEVIAKRIVVRGREPFRVTEIACEDDCFVFKADSDEAKTIHFVDVVFTAGLEPGELRIPVRIATDRGENRGAVCTVQARVVAPTEAAPAASGVSQPLPLGGVGAATAANTR